MTRQVVMQMMVVLATVNGLICYPPPRIRSMTHWWVDGTFVTEKKCKGLPLSTTGAKFKNGLEGKYKKE